MLKGRKILIGVSGSIAAYKTAFLIRLLVKNGAEVKVVMTPSAQHFITPLTLSTLSNHPVITEFASEDSSWNNHVHLALWADVFVLAPASANTIAAMANGICNNYLLAIYLSLRCPVMIAPAMDADMFIHPSTIQNISRLQSFGNLIIPSEEGDLASGLNGIGRMAEPETILEHIKNHLNLRDSLAGKKILITAGPTLEAIDPVRFIGNHSTGKMGYALAEACAFRGADVQLISGPVNITPSSIRINKTSIVSALDMYEACMSLVHQVDIIIMAAAVADYRPDHIEENKIKKKEDTLSLHLVKNKDILKELGAIKKQEQVLVGFALETNNELKYAQEKLRSKNLDMIIMNSLKDKGAGFGTDSNKVSIILKSGEIITTQTKSKKEIAEDIIEQIIKYQER